MSPHTEFTHSPPDLNLPNETLIAVFNELSPTTLADIAQVSHRFNAVAEWILYSSVYITDTLTDSSPVPLKTLRWCESMQRKRYLTQVLRKLHIRWQADPRTSPSQYLMNSCERVADVVSLLTPLESLELFLGPANYSSPRPEPIHVIERIIHGCKFSQLKSCSLGADWTKGAQPYTSHLTTFLASLPTLRHLKLPDHHSALDLPPEALPHLSTFRGSADTAASLLPGRPVQYLSLVGQDSDVNRENLPRMTCTTMPIRYLDLSAMSVRPMLLRNVSTYLPTVESLRIRLALRHTLHYSFSGIRLLAGLSTVLSAFQQLISLDLSPTEVDGVGRADAVEELALCREWGRGCPSLRRIIFPSQTEWLLDSDGVWISVQT
ncbi:hypothetical protein BDQ12DRAFT_603926 [Crucibulum laeve]|uniref:F-box domain-containing protein n=1 Tax=Crucibulum laeve TaxID=68775 RepID=A0A5C3M4Y3_9AGAR|nr:hypothetical protein BDQ12DRAFT_603926 [Crucibulum laeve]